MLIVRNYIVCMIHDLATCVCMPNVLFDLQCLQVYGFVRIFTDFTLPVRLYGIYYKFTDFYGSILLAVDDPNHITSVRSVNKKWMLAPVQVP